MKVSSIFTHHYKDSIAYISVKKKMCRLMQTKNIEVNRSEAKVDLVMIQTLLLFKGKFLCYHAN